MKNKPFPGVNLPFASSQVRSYPFFNCQGIQQGSFEGCDSINTALCELANLRTYIELTILKVQQLLIDRGNGMFIHFGVNKFTDQEWNPENGKV